MKPDWKSAPQWCTHWLELEGDRELWVDKEYFCVKIKPQEEFSVLVCPEVEDCAKFWELNVVQCIPRPQWKTLIHFKDSGKLVTYEADGQLAHSSVKRQLMGELGVDSSFRFVLEYKKLN